MRVRYWPGVLTRSTLRRRVPSDPEDSAWLAVAVPVAVALVSIGAGCGLLFDFLAAGLGLTALEGGPPSLFDQGLLLTRSSGILDLWSSISYPALSIAVGYALASASHSKVTSTDRLAQLYAVLRDAASNAPPPHEVVAWLRDVGKIVRQVDDRRAALRDALTSAWRISQSEREKSSSTKGSADVAREIDGIFGFRHLAATLESEVSEAGTRATSLCLQFVSEGEPSEFVSRPLLLQFHLFGRGVELERSHVDIELPSTGVSALVRVALTPSVRETTIRLLVTQPGHAEVLQQHDILLVITE